MQDEEVRSVVGARLGPTPGVIVGDFDGNGSEDVAVLVEYPIARQRDKAFSHLVTLLAFLRSDDGFQAVRLRGGVPGPDSGTYLTLQRRGGRGFDFEAGQPFICTHDSIGEWIFGKAGGTHVYDRGRFRFVLEVD